MNRLADVSRVTDDAGVSVHITYRSSLCEECGYELHGLDPGHPCPECGHVTAPVTAAAPRPNDLAWRRSVAVGLALLLWVMLDCVAAVLIQPFSDDLAGTIPALNVPAPKLWAVPLLQRAIGNAPERPGVDGSRAALMGLLALWLITARRTGTYGGTPAALRLTTRWIGLALFGAAFGALLASQGLWGNDRPIYRVLLLVGVELPVTTLLYVYLRRLADTVPGQDRRRLIGHLQWAMPLLMLAGAGLIAYQWLVPDAGVSSPGSGSRGLAGLLAGAAYGCLAVPCGVVATAAVGSLAASFAAAAFPGGWRVVSGSRRLAVGLWRQWVSADRHRLRAAGIAAGLVLLIAAAVLGNDRILWYSLRAGVGGNLPFFNFPGPKLWVGASVGELGPYWRYGILSHAVLLALNLAAVWLVTLRPTEGDACMAPVLRPLARWLAIAALGAAYGVAGSWAASSRQLSGEYRTELFSVITVLCEMPATVLMYLYLARFAGRELKRPALRTQLVTVAVVVPLLVCLALAAFVLSRELYTNQPSQFYATRMSVAVSACGAAYGAAMFAVATWVSVLLLSAAVILVREHAAGTTAPGQPAAGEADPTGLVREPVLAGLRAQKENGVSEL